MDRLIGLILAIAAVACETQPLSRRSHATATGVAGQPLREAGALIAAVRRAREAGHACGPMLTFPPLPHQTIGIVPRAMLTAIAEAKALELAGGSEFSHGEGSQAPARRARTLGYESELVGELLAKATPDAEATVRSWVRSPGHCRSLLSPRANELGAAHARDARGVSFWVLELGQNMRTAGSPSPVGR